MLLPITRTGLRQSAENVPQEFVYSFLQTYSSFDLDSSRHFKESVFNKRPQPTVEIDYIYFGTS
jgi:hypothetical protein